MTKIVGILNITPDSFSDGGKYIDLKSAMKQFEKMVEEGADIIDIGAQSTRPGAKKLSVEEEWLRLEPILKDINRNKFKTEISIDSFYPETIRRCLDHNISIINDVSGFENDEMVKLAANSGKKIIFMHSLSIPADKEVTLPDNINIVSFLNNWAKKKVKKLRKAGIKKENMIFDPGIGFGKTAEQSLEIISNAEKFKKTGIEILIGHSEKSFLNKFTNNPAGKRDIETQIISYILAKKKIEYLRVHDVAANKRAINVSI